MAHGSKGERRPPTVWSPLGDEYASACAQLSQADFDAAWAEGRAMTLEQAVAYALDEPPPA